MKYSRINSMPEIATPRKADKRNSWAQVRTQEQALRSAAYLVWLLQAEAKDSKRPPYSDVLTDATDVLRQELDELGKMEEITREFGELAPLGGQT